MLIIATVPQFDHNLSHPQGIFICFYFYSDTLQVATSVVFVRVYVSVGVPSMKTALLVGGLPIAQQLHRLKSTVQVRYYRSVPGKCPWALKHNSQFWPAWVLTRDQNSIRLYRNCYIYPLKWGTWALTPEVGTCPGHYGTCD